MSPSKLGRLVLGNRVYLGLVILVAAGLLTVTWFSVGAIGSITSDLEDAQIASDLVANVQRELLHLRGDVAGLAFDPDPAPLDLRRGLIARQIGVLQDQLATGDPRIAEVAAIDQRIDGVDWAALGALPAAAEDRRATIETALKEIDGIEVDFKVFYDRQVRNFYDTTSDAVQAKAGVQRELGAMLALGLLVTSAWVVLTIRRARSDAAAADEALRATEQRFRSLVQNSSDLTMSTDAAGIVTYVSPASVEVLGAAPDKLVGLRAFDGVHPEDTPLVLALGRELAADPGGSKLIRCRMRHTDGTYRRVESVCTNLLDDDAVRGYVMNVRDVTDRDRLDAELRHAQKLESVGQLAAGIAHEINTPIQFIGDNVRFLSDAFADLSRLAETYRKAAERSGTVVVNPESGTAGLETYVDGQFLAHEVPQALDQALEGVERVTTIVRAMKAFGHPAGEDKAPADLNDAVSNTIVVASNELKYVAEVVTDFGDLPPVVCDVSDINQVVLNLLVNAAHAIAPGGGAEGERGVITVRTRVEGDEVVVDVRDTGCGIPPEHADRVFEPFFTTKDVGAGTGQGLALAYSLVVERHGGSLGFVSEVGRGTTFTMRLPIAPRTSSSEGMRTRRTEELVP